VKRFDMDVDTHEAVWTLGARAAREARGKLDLDGAFIAAVRKYGTKVFPAAKGHEDDPWFEEYFQAFRDGAEAAGVNESTMSMRGLIRQLEEATQGQKFPATPRIAKIVASVVGDMATVTDMSGGRDATFTLWPPKSQQDEQGRATLAWDPVATKLGRKLLRELAANAPLPEGYQWGITTGRGKQMIVFVESTLSASYRTKTAGSIYSPDQW